jgi:DNA-binding GntR family transcriptional regulator
VSRPAVTTAVDAVAHELREAILAGRPAPGERLREEALAAHYQVARHTLRAALRALAAERLVVIEPHRGARVAALAGGDLTALFELRTALEVEAARLLGERGGMNPWSAEVTAAAEELDRLCAAIPDGDTSPIQGTDPAGAARSAVDAAHLALHHALVDAAGSHRITQAHAALAAESAVVLLQSRSSLSARQMSRHHRELLRELPRIGPDALRVHLLQGHSYGAASTAAQPPGTRRSPPIRVVGTSAARCGPEQAPQ